MTKSDDRFQTLHPLFSGKVRVLLTKAGAAGLNIDVFEGYRSFARQNEYVKRHGTVTKAKGGMSWHNYGLAVDIVFKDKTGAWSWAESHDWVALGKLGKSLGLIWGGNAKIGGDFATMNDRPHFEWHPGFAITDVSKALEIWNRTKTLAAIWNALKL